MADREGRLSHYEVLRIRPGSSPAQIDAACWELWKRYQSKSTTALWKEVKNQIEEIHDVLLDPDGRAAQGRVVLRPAVSPHPQDNVPSARSWQMSHAYYAVGVGSALLFRVMIEAATPQTWADLESIGWLSLLFAGATCGLVRTFQAFARREAAAGAG